MNITEEQLSEFTELIDDTVEYFCDDKMLSGELIYTLLECYSIAKLKELKGELTYENHDL